MKLTTEAKVGAFTLLGVILFAFSIIFLGKIHLFEPPNMRITGHFESVTGLKSGNAVRYSGVNVGRVKELTVTPEGVLVAMDIKVDTEIPRDSTFTLTGDGLLGDKFIQIEPGDDKTFLKNGDSVKGGGSSMDRAMKSADELLDEANKTLKSINTVIGDPAAQQSVRSALQDSGAIAKNIENMTAQMNALVAKNTENIDQLTANMVAISRNMTVTTNQINASMQKLDGDGATAENMRQIVANMKETSDSVNKMAHSLEGVVTDPQSSKDLKETLHNTAELSSRLNKMTGGGKGFGISAETSAEMLYNNQKDRYSPNFNFRLYSDKSMAEIGASHIGDGTKLELNYGRRLNRYLIARGGIFEGEAGLGLDYGLQSPFSVSVAVMDPNDVKYRIRSELRLFPNTYAVAQFIRPYSADNGGNYFGVNYKF